LAISLKLVHLMGGEIGVRSEMGKGSTFWFVIPFPCDEWVSNCIQYESFACKKQEQSFCAFTGGNQCVGAGYIGVNDQFSVAKTRVLIASENPVLLRSVSEQYSVWKMETEQADTLEHAYSKLRDSDLHKKPFDLVVIDENLKDGTGVELAQKMDLSTKLRKIAIIFLRSINSDAEYRLPKDMRVSVMAKPIGYSQMFDTTMTLLFSEKWGKFVGQLGSSGTTASSVIKINQKKEDAAKWKKRFENCTILIAEDNRVNQIVIINLLAESGIKCDLVMNGQEAIDAVVSKQYDMILMDCQMPVTDGYEATQLIRAWETLQGKRRTPIIALTANATKEDSQKCFDSGMDAFCSKPIDAKKLHEEIRKWLDT
ncbi:MAG: response regulator, partial [Thermoguttaceae bacterium]